AGHPTDGVRGSSVHASSRTSVEVEFPGPRGSQQGVPLLPGQPQHAPLRILRITHGDAVADEGDLHTVVTAPAVAALTPFDPGQVRVGHHPYSLVGSIEVVFTLRTAVLPRR